MGRMDVPWTREREKALKKSTGPPWYLYASGRNPSRGDPMDWMRLKSTLRELDIQMSEFGVTACIIEDVLVWSGVQIIAILEIFIP